MSKVGTEAQFKHQCQCNNFPSESHNILLNMQSAWLTDRWFHSFEISYCGMIWVRDMSCRWCKMSCTVALACFERKKYHRNSKKIWVDKVTDIYKFMCPGLPKLSSKIRRHKTVEPTVGATKQWNQQYAKAQIMNFWVWSSILRFLIDWVEFNVRSAWYRSCEIQIM